VKKKTPEAPQIMKRSERGVLDKALSQTVNAGEDAEAALRRLYSVGKLSEMSDQNVRNLLGRASELTGHLGLEKHGLSDADPDVVKKLLQKEYGYIEDVIPAVITDSDPESFIKKIKRAQKLGYITEDVLPELMEGNAAGMQIPAIDKSTGIYAPKAILVGPDGSPLKRAGVGMHEMQHPLDDLLGATESRPYDMGNVANIRKTSDNPFDALKAYTKDHHPGSDVFELDKANQILKGGQDFDATQQAQLRARALQGLTNRFGEGYTKTRSVASPFGAMAAMLGDIYRPEELPKANPVAQKQIADAYAAMKHDPTNPEVRRAYEALTSEIEQQYDDLVTNKGLKVSKITGDNPYKSSKDLVNDVRVNNRMSYFPTESGYGSAEGGSGSDHPLLKPSKYLDVDGKPMPANDLFRIVHDYYGHVEGDNKFGATGEERAFQQHKKMLSPEAQKALASETRGQNSWVNYGPFGEENRKNPANTTYAEQKAGLLPPQMTESLDKIENPRLHALEKLSKVTSKIAAPLGVLAGVSGSLADVKEGKYNTAGTRMITNMAPMGIGDLSDKLMESAELRDTSPELFDETYRQTLINIGKRRMREGRSPIVETISGRKVDTSAMDADDEVNKRNALLREKFGT
jgi:hypothetical protein